MPGVPMLMPSDTVMVLNNTPLPPAASTPLMASAAKSLMCMLQGVTMLQVLATPTWGFLKSASSKPTARSMARLGAWGTPSTMIEEYLRLSSLIVIL